MSTESSAPGRGPQRLRASDAEREQVAEVLRTAMTEGRLTLAEGEERLAKVYAAQYRDELTPLVGDLPDGGWQALHDTPEAKSHFRRHRRCHLGVATVVAGALVGLWLLSGTGFFWPAIPLTFIAIGLVRASRWRMHAGPWSGPRGRGWGTAAPPWARR